MERASTLAYCFCNMRLMHKPQSLASCAIDPRAHQLPKQTHDAIAEELGSVDDVQ